MQQLESRLMFAEWSCDEGSDPHDFENWKLSNPSLGVKGIAPVSALQEDYETKMSIQMFAREHLGMWDDPAMNSIIDFELWGAEGCQVEFGPEDGPISVCVDVAPDKGWASIAVAQRWPDGRQHAEVVLHRSGTDWIIGAMQRLIASSNPPRVCVVQAAGQAGAFGAELEQVGYKVKYFGTADIAQATSQFESDIEAKRFTHLDDPGLKAALGGADKYPIGNKDFTGGWGWLRKSPAVDITGIVACCYANRVLTLELVEESLNAPVKGGMYVPAKYRRA